MRIIDTHCHLQYPQYGDDREEVIIRAQNEGVGMICVGTDIETSRAAVDIANKYEGIWASVGIHPNELDKPLDLMELETLASSNKVVAIGEIGLDYYRETDQRRRKAQVARFTAQARLAEDLGLPMIIHCRDAHTDMLRLVNGNGVIHSFTGTRDDAAAYVERGMVLGINGIITFSRDHHEALLAVGREKIILETDAPYLSPIPHRGKRNEPVRVFDVAKVVSAIYKEDVTSIQEVTNSTALQLFDIHS